MPEMILPDEHLILIGMIAIRAEVVEQLLDMLLVGWFRDLPADLMQEVHQVGAERKARMLHEAFDSALPEERTVTEALFARLETAQAERKAGLHEAWVLSEALDLQALDLPTSARMPAAESGSRPLVTTRSLKALDRAFASIAVELTLLFARAREARPAPPPASPDRPGPQG